MGEPGATRAPHNVSLELSPAQRGRRFVRPKNNIDRTTLIVLGSVACLPVLMAFCRVLALPGGEALPVPGLGPLRALGEALEQSFTLEWVPPSDRRSIQYLLLLPTAALLVTLTRLTLGVRVLGLRAILIAIGFRAAGLLPSLVLMAIVVGTIVLVRPWMRRIRLPLFARIAVVLTLATSIMVGALLIAPWLRSETVWSVAFFPVIIMAMLAEGIARTLERDNLLTAIWRTTWTIALALVIAGAYGPVSRFTFQFPELIVTLLIAIVFVAEFLDLRLFQEGPAQLTRLLAGVRPWRTGRPKIAVVRNRASAGVIGRLGPPNRTKYGRRSVQRPVDALRQLGFEVKVFEGDMTLLRELAGFLPPDPRTGAPGGLVLNLATGVQGEGRLGHVPAMLEMAGVPYSGSGPVAFARLSDRYSMLKVLEHAAVPVARHCLVIRSGQDVDLEFPLAVRPRFEPGARRMVARNGEQLQQAVLQLHRDLNQPVLVEEIVPGRRIHAAVLGNGTPECLPLLEHTPGENTKTCPARLDEQQAARVRKFALDAFAAAGCRDYARIDFRISRFGAPVVVDVKWVDLFRRRGSFLVAAEAAGYDFPALMHRIIEEAAKRYSSAPSAGDGTPEAGEPSPVISLAEHRATVK